LVSSRSDGANSQIKWKRSLTAAPRVVGSEGEAEAEVEAAAGEGEQVFEEGVMDAGVAVAEVCAADEERALGGAEFEGVAAVEPDECVAICRVFVGRDSALFGDELCVGSEPEWAVCPLELNPAAAGRDTRQVATAVFEVFTADGVGREVQVEAAE